MIMINVSISILFTLESLYYYRKKRFLNILQEWRFKSRRECYPLMKAHDLSICYYPISQYYHNGNLQHEFQTASANHSKTWPEKNTNVIQESAVVSENPSCRKGFRNNKDWFQLKALDFLKVSFNWQNCHLEVVTVGW